MQKLNLKMISAAVAMTLVSTMSYGAGLGKLKVSSGLGEPLVAEIELLSVTPDELAGLTAEIASQAAYEAQSIERTSAAGSVRVHAGKRADGTPVLKLSSSQPISDPFLDMLVQVDWPSGRILREYTILLDPPSEITATTRPRIALPELNNGSVTLQNGNAATVVTPASEKKSSKRSKKAKSDAERLAAAKAEALSAEKPVEKPAEQAAAKPSNTENSTGSELTTQRGDTLGKIARENMPQGVNLDQMLIALYKANKDAFAGDNINRLKVGQIIRVPAAADIEAISKKEAHAEVIAQTQDWNAYRNNLAGVVADAPAKADGNDSQASAGKITTAVDQSAKPAESAKDVVKLSKNDTSTKNGNTTAAQTANAKAENDTAAKNAIKESDIKQKLLEKQKDDATKLALLKNEQLAAAQNAGKLAETQKTAEAAKPVTPSPVEMPKPVVDPVKPAEVAGTPAVVASVEAVKPAEEVKVDTPVVAVKPKIKTVVMDESVPAGPGIIESITSSDNFPLLGGAAGGLGLLGLGWLFMRNKRKKNITGFEHSIMTGGGLKGNTIFGNTGGATVDTGDTSFLTDFTNNPGGIIDTNEVDPIAEAEVYMAYGRDNQAEEILKDAIVKEPTRYELHLKLLEVLSNRNDSSAFEAIAGELYTALGTDDPMWEKVTAMGAVMEPNNPLYKAVEPEMATHFNSTSKNLMASDFDKTQILTANSLDFSLEDTLDGTKSLTADNSLDFEFGDNDDVGEKTSGLASAKMLDNEVSFESNSASDLDLSFDMPSMDLPKVAAEVPSNNVDAPSLTKSDKLSMDAFADSDLSFSLPEVEHVAETSKTASEFHNRFENVDSAIDFDFDSTQKLDSAAFGAVEGAEVSKAAPSLESNFAGISFDLDAEPTSAAASSVIEAPEVDTKLDLVAAYIDMGDKEGAKELLDEVLKEGGTAQRAKAKTLLSALA